MKEPFDYSIVHYTFGLCAAEGMSACHDLSAAYRLRVCSGGTGFPVNNEPQPAESDEKCL